MKAHTALTITLAISLIILCYGIYIGVMIGADWYGKDATMQWHMNNYFVIEGQYAYSIFGLATLALGGIATGFAMAAFTTVHKTKKNILILATAFFTAIALTSLGFNTLDFMLGCFYWTNMTYPPPVQIGFLAVDVWNFYFFFFVMPLWFGGLLMGIATSYYAFIHRPQQATQAYLTKKNLTNLIKPSMHLKEYIAESKVYSRSRGLIKENFDTTN
jgi:hypothetical protein